MPADVIAARLQAYHLMEQAQTEDHHGVRDRFLELAAEAEREGWLDAAQLAATGVVLYDLVHSPDRQTVEYEIADLVNRARGLDAPALQAVALAIRAISAGVVHDSPSLLEDAGRAVALVEREDLPPLDRCFAWLLAAGAYNAVGLWELADELYDRAALLAPMCEEPVQQAAVVVNRFLIRITWAAALFEVGDEEQALVQVRRAGTAVRSALRTRGLPRLWRLNGSAARHLLDFVKVSFTTPPPPVADVRERLTHLDTFRADLQAAGDVEVLPFLDSFVALGLLRLGLPAEARRRLESGNAAESISSGAHSFQAWVRAEASLPERPDPALAASREYGALVARMRWNNRAGVLGAARAKIAEEQLSAEHAELARDVMLDPLTGLLNRRTFDHWIAATPGKVRPTALLLIDVDSFKMVNDQHGHAVGDQALRRVARVISDHVRTGDTALRLGGDEFAVILSAPGKSASRSASAEDALLRVATERAQAISEAIAGTDWQQMSRTLGMSVSIGIAAASLGPRWPDAADLLYRQADANLYEAKFRRASRGRDGEGGLGQLTVRLARAARRPFARSAPAAPGPGAPAP